uniref:HPP family protein n=1 Tax=Corynebacterium variabile TaxID=1727 RepID=UPI0028ACE96C|nr:HPP family protein [Corynebacterium variabile]
MSGFASMVVIALLGFFSDVVGHPLLMASFGASCVLEFVLPKAPVSQPINVIGGHMISAVAGLTVVTTMPTQWWSMSLATGVAIMVMVFLRVLHPPAAGIPLIIMLDGETWSYLLTPVVIGAIFVTMCGALYPWGMKKARMVR